jgi:hypothetical protein
MVDGTMTHDAPSLSYTVSLLKCATITRVRRADRSYLPQGDADECESVHLHELRFASPRAQIFAELLPQKVSESKAAKY